MDNSNNNGLEYDDNSDMSDKKLIERDLEMGSVSGLLQV